MESPDSETFFTLSLADIRPHLPESSLESILQMLKEKSATYRPSQASQPAQPASQPASPTPSFAMECDFNGPNVPLKRSASQRSSSSSSESSRAPTTETESDTDSTSSSKTLTEFKTVENRRKRLAKQRSPKPPVTPVSPIPPVPLMSIDIDPATLAQNSSADTAPARKATPPTSRPHTRCDPQPAKVTLPPPVFVRDVNKWTEISTLCTNEKVHYTHAKNVGVAVKVQTPTRDDFRNLTRLLTTRKVAYHTYALPEERKVRAVLRNMPHEISNEDIHKDLVAQGFPAESVHKMYSRTGKVFPLALVIMTNTPSARDLFRAKDLKVCGLSEIKVEPPHRRGTPGQCHRCQLYGHAAANCSAPPRCVKCLVPHPTKECTRTRDSPDPPACVLCGQVGHTANYKGCPRAPRPNPPSKKKAQAPSHKKAPKGPPPPTNEHFPLAPKSRGAPIPQAPKPAWGPPPQPPKANLHPKKAPASQSAPSTSPQNGSPLADDLNVVLDAIRGIDIGEISVLAAKLRKARTPQERLIALCEHQSLLSSL